MKTGTIVLICILGALALLLLFMILRAVFARPKALKNEGYTPIDVDKDEVAEHLSQAVQIPTITVITENQSYQPFLEYHKFLEKTYPLIHAKAEKTIINGYSLIIKYPGEDNSLLPGCFLAHQDVVPAPVEGWEVDPFAGTIKDGYVYGRGSQDMKGQMIAALEGLELLLRQGFVPKRTIYYCFGHDEEYTGKEGASAISDYLLKSGIRFEFVIDEGGTVLDGSLLGVDGMVALIGTCEKGYVDYLLTSRRDGGHASAPQKRSSVDAIAEAILDLKHIPMKSYWSKPVKETFKTLAPYMNPLYKFLFVNADILSPLLKAVLTLVNPITNSILRTTFAFTQMEGASAPNVIPTKATAVVNCRINIGQTQKEVKEHIQKVVGKNIEVTELNPGFDPSPVSRTDTEVYKVLVKSITQVFDKFIPAPYPFIAATDAKYYYKVSDNVYRFTPFLVSMDDQHRIHALNERCDIGGLVKATQFFACFIQNTCN